MNKIEQAADFLADKRQNPAVYDEIPADFRPQTLSEAYQVQAALVERLLSRLGGGQIGYKIACTNGSAQALLQVDGPFYGSLLSTTTFKLAYGPAPRFDSRNYTVRAIEAEFSFEIGADVPHRADPYQPSELIPFIRAVFPSIELVDWRFNDFGVAGGLAILADNAIHAAHVLGRPVMMTELTAVDFAEIPVELFVNGALKERGSGREVLGSPLIALSFLVEELAGQGRTLRAGEIVTTGVATDIYLAVAGDHLMADFGPLGQVELRFT